MNEKKKKIKITVTHQIVSQRIVRDTVFPMDETVFTALTDAATKNCLAEYFLSVETREITETTACKISPMIPQAPKHPARGIASVLRLIPNRWTKRRDHVFI